MVFVIFLKKLYNQLFSYIMNFLEISKDKDP